ncbi:hypothetical protein ABW19_dt0201278 [Dactylella cylindrospora]|nr:hypothetical protein ABW19_dt0201278 [Dactylella cylindrospora]
MPAKNLADLPYEILLQICEELDKIRHESSKFVLSRPEFPAGPSRQYVQFRPTNPPKKPHDSPRRAEKYRLRTDPRVYERCPVPEQPFEGVSSFDGLSRVNKHLRELCLPYLFKNAVMASDDCLKLDRLEYYSKAGWMLKHVKSIRFFATYSTWPNSLGNNTPTASIPSAIKNSITLLTTPPSLSTLHFIAEPTFINEPLRKEFAASGSPSPFANVKDLYITVGSEWLLPLCGTESGLEVFEYVGAYGTKSPNKVEFDAWRNREGLYGGMRDTRAIAIMKGLEELKGLGKCSLKRVTLGVTIHSDGIMQLAPFMQNVTELNLLHAVAGTCVTALPYLQSLLKIRFGTDEDAIMAKNPSCYMTRADLIRVCENGRKLKEVGYKGRFIAYVRRLGGGEEGDVDEENTKWSDTWAQDGIGNP